jgi:acetoin utilization protein AcuB
MLTVGSIATRRVVTVDPDAPLPHARALLAEHQVRHLAVVENERLVGVLSDRDLIERPPVTSERLDEGAPIVRDRMSARVESVGANESLARACRRMLERRVSCLPVMDHGRLAAILTEHDLMRVYEHVCRYSGHDPAFDPPVETRASSDLASVGPSDLATEALARCRASDIRHLPVLQGGHVVGVVSERDLLSAAGGVVASERPVGELMTDTLVAVQPGTRLSTAAARMAEAGIHSLLVLERGNLRGIVTSADILAALCAIDEHDLASAWAGEVALRAEAEEP